MHISRVDLNLFVVFDAIYTEGGITAAARTLNLTQPAVSHALGRLRELFDDPLFERRGQGMVPTPLARTLIAEVRTSLQGFERTLREGTRFDPATSERRFTISMRDALEATLLPPLMAAIAKEAPRIDVTTVRGDRRQLEAELLAGTIDAVADILLPASAAIRHAPILSDPMVVLARPGHPITQAPLTLDRYLACEHVQVSSRRRGAGLEDVELRRLGRERRQLHRLARHATNTLRAHRQRAVRQRHAAAAVQRAGAGAVPLLARQQRPGCRRPLAARSHLRGDGRGGVGRCRCRLCRRTLTNPKPNAIIGAAQRKWLCHAG